MKIGIKYLWGLNIKVWKILVFEYKIETTVAFILSSKTVKLIYICILRRIIKVKELYLTHFSISKSFEVKTFESFSFLGFRV